MPHPEFDPPPESYNAGVVPLARKSTRPGSQAIRPQLRQTGKSIWLRRNASRDNPKVYLIDIETF
jgi:hypothetical protein